jgi:lipoyl(octanoyl) transferase
MTRDELFVCHLGTVPYLDAVVLQERVRAQRQAGELPDTLLLLEHPSVYTRGRRSADGDLGAYGPDGLLGADGADFTCAREIDIVDTDRGGRVTYHGPGQLVGYPIMHVSDIGFHLRTMEASIVSAVAQEGVTARSRHDEGIDYTGVWVGSRKIASIGVHVSRGVSTHGFAVNIDNDLDPFSWVIACGLPDVAMTSLTEELGTSSGAASDPRHADYDSAALPDSDTPLMACFRKRMAAAFCQAHGRRQRLVSPQRLGIDAPLARPSSQRVAVSA